MPADDSSPTPASRSFWYTHPRPSGNRLLDGRGEIRAATPVEFAPAGVPQWLVAHPAPSGSRWTVVTTDGRATRWHVSDGDAVREATFEPLPAGLPPVVTTAGKAPKPLRPPGDIGPGAGASVWAGTDAGRPTLLYHADSGDLVIADGETTRFPVDGLPDGRLAALGRGRFVTFGAATDRYRHGALGDTIEGSSLVVVDASEPSVVARTSLPEPSVFEGLQPLAADLDGDGNREIVTTVADATDGARIALFDAAGDRIATGPIYGSGWRHQLAVAPFSPDGRAEIAVVRKPHVEHVLEFYRLVDDQLAVSATLSGFRSHTYGSRNIDGAVAGDLNGDGRVELLVPTTDRRELAAVRRSAGDASVVWRRALGGRLATNLTGVTLPDGRVAVGAGTGETVRVWQ